MQVEPTDESKVATMTVDAAATRLGIGRQLAYDLEKQGKLPGALRLGRRIVVVRKKLEAFLDGQCGPN